jgi:hypothetical protein
MCFYKESGASLALVFATVKHGAITLEAEQLLLLLLLLLTSRCCGVAAGARNMCA